MTTNTHRSLISLLLICASALISQTAGAQERITFNFDSRTIRDGLPAPWSFKRWSPMIGLGSFVAEAKVVNQGGKKVLHLKSEESGFLVGAKRDIDVSQHRWASWSWKAITLPTGGNFKARATNDQALQLLFGFEGGKIVGYIWDSTGTTGATGSGLAFREDVRVIVIQAGKAKLNQWVEERRNLYDDFQTLFKATPPTLQGLAIQSNSQHTTSKAEGFVGPITLSKN